MLGRNKSKVILIVVFIILSGFGRGYVMENINNVYRYLVLGVPNYARSEFFWLIDWSPSAINKLKWFLTIFWSAYFFVLTYVAVRYIFPKRTNLLSIVVFGYGALIGASALIYLYGYAFSGVDRVYDTVRTLMGVAQSFVPLMLFYLVFKFMLNENDYSEKE